MSSREFAVKVARRLQHLSAEITVRVPRRSRIRAPHAGPRILVSLTSYPARIDAVWVAVESILRQVDPPDEVLLVLSADEFPDRKIPVRLERRIKRGLRIIWVEGNIRSYKKLLPVRRAHPDDVIVTADDDIIYPRWWLGALLEAHRERPDHIIGHRGSEILLDDHAALQPYRRWPSATAKTPSQRLFLTTGGGVLWPPLSLPDVALDEGLALDLCPTADDIWFKAMTLLSGTPLSKVADGAGEFHTSFSASQVGALWHVNVVDERNNPQFERTLTHFGLWPTLTEETKRS
jgi:hypothetical protein